MDTLKPLDSPAKLGTSYITPTGRLTFFGVTRDQSNPSISIDNCVAVKETTPSQIGGQVNRPSSSHFVTRTMPLPSHAKSFTRSDRFERKMKTSPQYGLARSASVTSADKVCTLFLKSTGCAANMIFRSAENEITRHPEPQPEPSPVSHDRRRSQPGSGPPQYRSRSVLGFSPPAMSLPWRPVPLNDVEHRLMPRQPDRSSPRQSFGLAPGRCHCQTAGAAISSAIREPHHGGALRPICSRLPQGSPQRSAPSLPPSIVAGAAAP
jgi:hypothetical protein